MALIGAEAAVASAVTFFAAAIAFAYLADSIGLRIVPALVLVAAAAAAAAAFLQMRRGGGRWTRYGSSMKFARPNITLPARRGDHVHVLAHRDADLDRFHKILANAWKDGEVRPHIARPPSRHGTRAHALIR